MSGLVTRTLGVNPAKNPGAYKGGTSGEGRESLLKISKLYVKELILKLN